jgi:hypothetical protein
MGELMQEHRRCARSVRSGELPRPGYVIPVIEPPAHEFPVVRRRQCVPPYPELIAHRTEHRIKSPRVSHALEALHPAFSFTRRAIGILRAIIQPPALPMGNAGHRLSPRCRVASQLIGDNRTWTVTHTLKQLAEEPLRSAFVASRLNKGIENFTTLIHRPSEIDKLPVYFAEDFIKMPGVATRTASSVQPSRVLGTKLECPQSNRLVRDFYAPGQYELGTHPGSSSRIGNRPKRND